MSMSMTIGVFYGIALYWCMEQERACSGVWNSEFEHPVSRNDLSRVTVQYETCSVKLDILLKCYHNKTYTMSELTVSKRQLESVSLK